MGGLPRGTIEAPPAEGTMDVPVRPSTAHVAHEGYHPGVWMDNTGPDSKGGHQYKRHWPDGYTLKGFGGAAFMIAFEHTKSYPIVYNNTPCW